MLHQAGCGAWCGIDFLKLHGYKNIDPSLQRQSCKKGKINILINGEERFDSITPQEFLTLKQKVIQPPGLLCPVMRLTIAILVHDMIKIDTICKERFIS